MDYLKQYRTLEFQNRVHFSTKRGTNRRTLLNEIILLCTCFNNALYIYTLPNSELTNMLETTTKQSFLLKPHYFLFYSSIGGANISAFDKDLKASLHTLWSVRQCSPQDLTVSS
jgi:hypothetical protein